MNDSSETVSGEVHRKGWLYAAYAWVAITVVVGLSGFVYPQGDPIDVFVDTYNVPLLRMERLQIGIWTTLTAAGVLGAVFCQWMSTRPRNTTKKRVSTVEVILITLGILGFVLCFLVDSNAPTGN